MTATKRPRPRLSLESLEARAVPTVGGLDPYFSGDGKATWSLLNADKSEEAAAVAVQADGKVVVAGSVERAAPGDFDFFVIRYNRDGSLDATFGTNGRRVVAFDLGGDDSDMATGVALDDLGRILVGGTVRNAAGDYDFAACRLTPAGQLDTSFSGDGKAVVAFDLGGDKWDFCHDIAWRDGRIVLGGGAATAGGDDDFAVCRLLEDGSLDTSLNGTGKKVVAFDLGGSNNDFGYAVAIDGAGRIILAGNVARTNDIDFGVCRLDFDGTLDVTFSGDGKAVVFFDKGDTNNDECRAMALDKNGNILLAGSADTAANGTDFAVCRLTTFGTLDPTFQGTGKQTIAFDKGGTKDDRADAVVVQPDGYVVLGGKAQAATGSDFALVRFGPNGGPDWSLNPADDGKATYAFDLGGSQIDACNAVAWTADGLVLVGSADTATNGYDAAVLRVVESNRVLVSPDVGGPPTVKVYSTTGLYLGKIDVYGAAFKGGVRTAAGDVTGDGIDDILCAPGVGGSPIVKIYDGATLQFVKSIQVYGLAFTKGVNLAAGDVLGGGGVELVVGPGPGGAPYVNVFDVAAGTLAKQIQAYGLAFTKGVRVAVGDTAGDAKKEILVAPEAGGAPTVNVIDATTSAIVKQIQALDAAFTGGLYLATGKGAFGKDDLYVGPGTGGPNVVRRFEGPTGALWADYDVFVGGPNAGVRVGTTLATYDDRHDIIAATGPGTAPKVTVRSEDVTGGVVAAFDPFEAAMTAGLFVSGARR